MFNMASISFLILLLYSSLLASSFGEYPFRNVSLTWNQRVTDLISRLTLNEKVQQMMSSQLVPAIERLGIKPYSWNTECLRGDVQAGNATSFPQALGLAAAFSTQIVFDIAQATSVEVRAKYNDYRRKQEYGSHKGLSCFSPVLNIMRHPLWGRNQETYGEDPYLTGVLGRQFVLGLQGDDPRYVRTNAGCKHFDVHSGPENIPVSRFSFNAQASVTDLRLTYLPAFKECVDAGSYSVMCSYNSINGIPSCANQDFLRDILRDDFGFTGYVISDYGAIEFVIEEHHYYNYSVDAAAGCLNAGCNIESTWSPVPVYGLLGEAISQGKITEELLDERLTPLMYTRMRLGEFDPPEMNPYSRINLTEVQSAKHQELSVQAAMKSFVLLKNVDNFLPLNGSIKPIAIVGPMATNITNLYGDYSPTIDRNRTVTILGGFQRTPNLIYYGAGCNDNKCQDYDSSQIKEAVQFAQVIVVCLGTGQEIESEGRDRSTLDLPGKQMLLLQDAVKFGNGTPVLLLLFTGGPVDIRWADQRAEVKGILECFFPAQSAGEAVRRVVFKDGPGSVPAGRLPFTWPASLDQVPSITNYSMDGRTYRYSKEEPLYPFGYGLSYTFYNFDKLDVPSNIKAGENQTVTVTVSNVGQYIGEEVVQVYISWLGVKQPMPQWQLVGFQRVLFSQVTQVLTFTITPQQMAIWDSAEGFVILPGDIMVYAGGQQPHQKRSSGSHVLSAKFTIQGKKKLQPIG